MKKIIFITMLTLIASVTMYGRGGNGKVVNFKGKVYILKYLNKFKKTPIKRNQVIKPQDIILTKGGVVKVKLPDGSTVVIRPNSRVQFALISKKSQRINLGKGGLLSKVSKLRSKKGYSVNTPTSIAGVRGTKFIVEYDEASKGNTVDVFEGSVNFGHNKDKNTKREGGSIKEGDAVSTSKKGIKLRSANRKILKKYERLLDEAVANISGWEYN